MPSDGKPVLSLDEDDDIRDLAEASLMTLGHLWTGLRKPRLKTLAFSVSSDHMSFAGASDWTAERGGRLPSIEEVYIYRTQLRSQCGPIFIWTELSLSELDDMAWAVDLETGHTFRTLKTTSHLVLCVKEI